MPLPHPTLARRVVSEFLGSAFLLAAIAGSGIMAERLSGGNAALALLANSLATGAALLAIIHMLRELSGPHLNPVVTLADAWMGGLHWRHVPPYLAAQCGGALVGVFTAHAMFALPLITHASHVRSGPAQWFSEFVATFGLLAVIWGVERTRPAAIPLAVAAYITAAYWFTSSTSFANPAVTLARALTGTFTGIRPQDVLPFVAAQLLGAAAATALFRWLLHPAQPAGANAAQP